MDAGSSNLPAQTTSFLGRAAELAELARLLASPEVRLLTICGPGGIGKTRLAIEAAARDAGRFTDGVVFVPLQPVRSAAGVPAAIAEALAIPLTGAAEPYDQVLAALREKRMLMLLDNAEQLGQGAALLGRLLAAAPGLRLLVTSREALRLREEWRFPLGGLAAPGSGADSDALRLFLARTGQARPDLSLEAERAAASEICRLVEGMPLAIELAASWTHVLSCAAIAAEVRRGLDVLASNLHNIPERHRSLRAVCDQSWALLGPEERRVFARLAVFRAGFSLEAATTTAQARLPVLDALIGKSLVRRVAADRYQIHELLRQYGEERLRQDGSAAAETGAAVGRFYADLLSHWFEHCAGGGISPAALAALAPELENIRAAWADILAQSDGEALRRVAHMIQYYYFVRGPYADGVALVAQALQQLRGRPAAAERAIAIADCLNSLGWFRLRQGYIAEARERFAESAAIYAGLDAARPSGDATDPAMGLGVVALVVGDYREAERLGMAALRRGEAERHHNNLAGGLYVLANAARAQGQYHVARRHARRLYASARGNRWFLAYCLIELGHIACALQAYPEARRHYAAAYLLREELADPEGMAIALAAQGKAALLDGQPAEAGQLYERSLAIYRYLGDQGGLAAALDGLGRAQIALGSERQARRHIEQALRIATEIAFTPLQLAILASAAELLSARRAQQQVLALARLVARHPAADQEVTRRAHALLLDGPAAATLDLAADRDEDVAAAVASALHALGELALTDRPESQADPAPAETAAEPLNEREREILGHIAAGRSNQEIAERLIFSVGTVKWYTTQIYGKLGVKSRTQAIARARELGMIA